MARKYKSKGRSSSQGTVLVAIIILAGILVSVLGIQNGMQRTQSSAELQNNISEDSARTATSFDEYMKENVQQKCLSDAETRYQDAWKSADSDGDGKLTYQNGFLSLTTNFYDDQINCYFLHKTATSDSRIADIQSKRQQEVDKYKAYLEAVSSAARSANSSRYNNSKTPVSCWSKALGEYTYTNCY